MKRGQSCGPDADSLTQEQPLYWLIFTLCESFSPASVSHSVGSGKVTGIMMASFLHFPHFTLFALKTSCDLTSEYIHTVFIHSGKIRVVINRSETV